MDHLDEVPRNMQQTAPLIEAMAIGMTAAIAGHAVGGTLASTMDEGARKFGRDVGITDAFEGWGRHFNRWKSQWTHAPESPSHTAVNAPEQLPRRQDEGYSPRRGSTRGEALSRRNSRTKPAPEQMPRRASNVVARRMQQTSSMVIDQRAEYIPLRDPGYV